MTKKVTTRISYRLALSAWLTTICLMLEAARLQVQVVDASSGKPLRGVEVRGWFSNDNGWKAWTVSAPVYESKAITDLHGKCLLVGRTNTGRVGFSVENPGNGYYPSPNVKLTLPSLLLGDVSGTIAPAHLEVLKLDRIGKPVPMFVKNVFLKKEQDMSEWAKGPVAYDLMVGDCLPPFGKGIFADVIFERMPRKVFGRAELRGRPDVSGKAFRDEVVMTFTGESNGLLEVQAIPNSGIKIRTVPAIVYESRYMVWQERRKDLKVLTSNDKDKLFCFRIRTCKNDHGEITEAYYGKIYGGIGILCGGEVKDYAIRGVRFKYYLNPTLNERNLEWDMKNNLCTNPGNIGQPQP